MTTSERLQLSAENTDLRRCLVRVLSSDDVVRDCRGRPVGFLPETVRDEIEQTLDRWLPAPATSGVAESIDFSPAAAG